METTEEKNVFVCHDCDNEKNIDERRNINGGNYSVCESCYEENNYFTCEQCEEALSDSCYDQDGICRSCAEANQENEDREGSDTSDREYDQSDKHVEAGKRAVSCEIECYYPDRETQERVSDELPEEIGIAEDGSLGGGGKEFQTPKLSGAKGMRLLKKLCDKLVKNDYRVNKTCGVHIHLDTSDIMGKHDQIQKLILFYLAFEPVLYSFLPYSRRKNGYCLPLAQFYQENEIVNANSVEELEKIWYREQSREHIEQRKKNRQDQTRYAGVNLHSLLSNGHIELRHHSGTMDYLKIKSWIDLYCAILDLVASKESVEIGRLTEVKYMLELSGKMRAMFELLKLEEPLQAYFTARAEKFAGVVKEENICVE